VISKGSFRGSSTGDFEEIICRKIVK
jgi:hypothetical protein